MIENMYIGFSPPCKHKSLHISFIFQIEPDSQLNFSPIRPEKSVTFFFFFFQTLFLILTCPPDTTTTETEAIPLPIPFVLKQKLANFRQGRLSTSSSFYRSDPLANVFSTERRGVEEGRQNYGDSIRKFIRLELVGGRAEEICPADNRIEVTAHT